MEKLYYYIKFEFKHFYKKAIFLSLIICILQNFVLAIRISIEQIEGYIRFENLILKSPYIFLFYLMFIGFLVVIAVTLTENYFGTKSIYSLLTVPTPRAFIYFSKLIAGLLSVFIIYSAQIINIFISYGLYKIMIPVENQITNGLALAMLRSPFLATLIPINPLLIIWNIITIIFILTAILYIITALNNESSRPYLTIIIALAIIIMVWVTTIQTNTFGISSFLTPMSQQQLAQMAYKNSIGIRTTLFIGSFNLSEIQMLSLSIVEVIFVETALIIGGIRIYEKTNI